MQDEVAKNTELNEIPSGRGSNACPHEGDRYFIFKAGGKLTVRGQGISATGNVHAQGPAAGQLEKALGLGALMAVPGGFGISIAVVMAIVGAAAWLIAVASILGTIVMLAARFLLKNR